MKPDQNLLRAIPKVDTLLELARSEPELARVGHARLMEAIRQALENLRQNILAGRAAAGPGYPELQAGLLAEIKAEIKADRAFSLRPVINATGVVLHTNLGRAVLSVEAAAQVARVAASYSTVEYDPADGGRGSRQVHVESLLTRLTGGEAAMAVNNNAAAVLLMLTALFKGREVIVSRGELVEIGGSFRIPDIMEEGGAVLRAVGATNRTRALDYARAIDPGRTGGLLKVHPSNFRLVGYAEETPVAELAALARAHRLPLVCDVGSGTLVDLEPLGISGEPPVSRFLEDGADLVSFSGDKLLGGAQAGLIVGRRDYVAQLKAHPLARALRVDKLTLAALEATLRLYLDPEEARRSIPTLAMLFAGPEELRAKAEQLKAALSAVPGLHLEVTATAGQAGGGSAPEQPLPSWAVAVAVPGGSVARLEEALRQGEPPVVARLFQERLLLDARTIQPGEFSLLAEALTRAGARLGI